jgi:Ca2+-binding EF-hand superfamily protein
VLNKVREDLNKRGVTTIRGLGRAFKIMDSVDGNRKVTKEEFYIGLKDFGVTISKKEAEALLEYLDTDDDGCINYDEFLKGIRGKPNQRRQTFIDKAFYKFDKDGSGVITSADLRGVYNCSSHPKVISGQKTEDEIFTEYLSHFGDKNRDGKITKSEWNDYYAAISANIDNDDHFI